MRRELDFNEDSLDGKWNNLLFDVTFNVDYHRRRCAHYDWVSKTTDTLVMFSATLIFSQISGYLSHSVEVGRSVVGLVSFTIMLLSVIKFYFEFEKKARIHNAAYRSFLEIRRDMELSQKDEKSIAKFTAKKYSLYVDEGAVYQYVSWMAHNAALDGIGAKASAHIKISWWHRLIAHYWRGTLETPKTYIPTFPAK